MRFAPEYVAHVLNENFEDAKELFAGPLIAIHYAHLVMLADCGIVSQGDAHAIRVALDQVAARDLRAARYDGTVEDLFFYIERLIVEAGGEDAAGRLHTARSRNDIDMTMYRMRQRELVLGFAAASFELRRALLDLAERHGESVFTVHTHTQRAQPTTIAHYLLAVIEQLERDCDRLRHSYDVTNHNPLGACAITGTGFPIDRNLTSDLLGFCGPTGNTYGSIATVDYLLESVSAAAVLLVGVGRFTQDLLLWSSAEFGYLRLGDGFVQSSSVMPQKRNPVGIEHVRALSSKALGQAQAVISAVHNTPFGDIVDTEDDLQPLVFAVFRDATRAVRLEAAALSTAEFDVERLEATAADGWTTVTELADTLVRDHGTPFRVAHAICARLIARAAGDRGRSMAAILAEVTSELTGKAIRYSDDALATILSARHFVMVRRTPGGPAPEATSEECRKSRTRLDADTDWWNIATSALRSAERRLEERSRKL